MSLLPYWLRPRRSLTADAALASPCAISPSPAASCAPSCVLSWLMEEGTYALRLLLLPLPAPPARPMLLLLLPMPL